MRQTFQYELLGPQEQPGDTPLILGGHELNKAFLWSPCISGHTLTHPSTRSEGTRKMAKGEYLEFFNKSKYIGAYVMPTVFRSGPYRFYFYSHEPNEPPHVHVDRDSDTAKFWIDPVGLARNLGYSGRELRTIERIIREHQQELLEAWNDWFGPDPR
jgi:hypothetical protein